MTEMITVSKEDLDNLRERVSKLAMEKSYLELAIRMMSSINAAPGLDNTIDSMLKQTMDVVGGTNLILYYRLNDDLFYTDVYGKKLKVDTVDDPLVRQAFETREPVEYAHEFLDTKMATPEFTKAYTWVFPLLVGTDLIGVMKMESLVIDARVLSRELPTFFNYAALVLKNEIQGASRLKQAYDQLSVVNSELAKSKEELEIRVAERTVELRDTNEQLQEELAERKRAERSLALTNFALSNVHEAAFLVDENARFHYVNEESCRILGYTHDELLGMSVSDVDPDFPLERWPDHWNELKTRRSLIFEGRHKAKDGRVFPVEINANYFEYEGQAYNLGLARDITERKRAEQALKWERDYLDRLRNALGVAVFAVKLPQRKIVNANKYAEVIFGYAPEEFVGRTTRMLYPDRRGYVEFGVKLKKALDEGKDIMHTEQPFRRRNGEIFPAEICVTFFREDGRVTDLISIARDITDRKRAEESLRQSEQRLRLHVEQTPLGVIEWDTDFRVIRWNPAAEKIFGYTADEALGRHSRFIVPAPVRAQVDRIWHDLLTQAGGIRSTNENVTKDGSVILCEWYNTPLTTSEGTVVGVASLVDDVTDRKKAEEERLANLHFFESMDRVNRAMQAASDLEQMMGDVLDVVLSVFDCDRVYLQYPLDPEAAVSRVPMERTRPEYPGAFSMGADIPIDETEKPVFQLTLATSGPLTLGPGSAHPIPPMTGKRFNTQSIILIAIYPKLGKPWLFGLHQCSYPRVWTPQEERLFQEIGRRLADSLSTLLAHRDLRESEQNYRLLYETLRKTNRTLKMLSNVNQALIHSTQEPALLDDVCKIAVDIGAYRMVWIGYAEQDPAKTVRPIAYAGHDDELFQAIRVTWADDEWGRGPTGTAIRTNKPVFVNDITTDPSFAPWRQEAMERGYGSCISVPLSNEAGVFGALVLYGSGPEEFEEEEIELLMELAGDLSYGITSLRTREERKRAAEELRYSEEKYLKLYESMMDGFALSDMDGRILEFNRPYIEMLGYSADELRNLTYADITPLKWHDYEQEIIEKDVLACGYSDTYEKEYRRKDGTTFPVELRKYLLRDDEGNPIGMWSVVRDISERKRVEEEKRQFYRATIRSVTDGKLEISDRAALYTYQADSDLVRTIRSARELSFTRKLVESYCLSKGLQSDTLSLFKIAVGEAMTNALKHADGGQVFCGASDWELWVGVCDTGPGIATLTLPAATLMRGYSTKISMGMGYSIILEVSDRVMLSTGPEGTIVIMFKNLIEAKPAISLEDLADTWDTIKYS